MIFKKTLAWCKASVRVTAPRNVLEDPVFKLLLLANPQPLKALQGRKSDQRDAKRIAEFLQDGRLDGSFVPPAEIRLLRILRGIGFLCS